MPDNDSQTEQLSHADKMRQEGVPEEEIQRIEEIWATGRRDSFRPDPKHWDGKYSRDADSF